MYFAMYKNGSFSSWLGAMDGDGSEAIAVDDDAAIEGGSKELLSVEEPIAETFVWRKESLDLGPSELGDVGGSVELELEEAHGLGVG